jgi:hypothetical protein
MPGASRGLHSTRLGLKQDRSDPVDYMTNLISGNTTFDPPSLATVTGALSSGITVTGAAIGDMVELFPPYDMQGIMAYGFVSAANTIKISLFNPTAGTIDLASGSWGYKVIRG